MNDETVKYSRHQLPGQNCFGNGLAFHVVDLVEIIFIQYAVGAASRLRMRCRVWPAKPFGANS